MNKARRAEIAAIQARLKDEKLVVSDLNQEWVDEIKTDIESIRDDEQEYYDGMPESFQNGEKGETAQSAINALDEAISGMDDVLGSDDRTDALLGVDSSLEDAAA